MQIWDYRIQSDWKPKSEKEWAWFLVRKINYGEFKNLPKNILRRLFPRIKKLLDPGKRAMLTNYLKT
jgi:hypothetical protein